MSNYPGYPPVHHQGAPGMYPQMQSGMAPGMPSPYPGAAMPGYPPQVHQQPGYYPPPAGVPGFPPGGAAAYPPQQFAPGYGQPPPHLAGYPPQQHQQIPGGYPPGAVPVHYPAGVAPMEAPGMTAQGPMLQASFPHDEPTVRPCPTFNAENDAKTLHTAMKGMGTDEKAIVDVLANRSLAQRLQIAIIYKTMYGKDLRSKLKSELRGNFEDVVIAMLKTPDVYDAESLHDAICGIGTKEDALIEIICSRSNQELMAVKAAYKFLYKKDLEKDIVGDTSGYFKRIMVACMTGGRTEGYTVDPVQAKKDAEELYKAGPKQLGTDESKFVQIFALRSFAHLAYMFEEFRKLANKDMESVVKGEMSGNLEETFVALVKLAKNKHAYFAERLYYSMKGAGTHDRIVIRVIVTRCERDLECIKKEFQRMYGKTLASFISSDCSGDYKKMLLALVK